MSDLLSSFSSFAVILPVVVLVVAATLGIFVYALQKPTSTVTDKKSQSASQKTKSKAKVPKEDKKVAKKVAKVAPAKAVKKDKVVVAEPVVVASPVKETTKKPKEIQKKKSAAKVVVEEVVAAPITASFPTKATKKSAKAIAPVVVAPQEAAVVTKAVATKKTKVVAAPVAVTVPTKAAKAKKTAKSEEADDGSWLTVPTKSEKKKTKEDGSAIATKTSSTATTPEKTSKQLKDQSNKAKKEASAAANSPSAEIVQTATTTAVANPAPAANVPFVEKTPYIVHTVDLASLPSVVAQFPNNGANTGFEYLLPALNDERKQADLISKIEEAIGDVVVKPLPPIFRPFKQQEFESRADLFEKSDEQKLIENSGVAFDELADAWTDAKAPKRTGAAAKKKVRKD